MELIPHVMRLFGHKCKRFFSNKKIITVRQTFYGFKLFAKNVLYN